MGLLDDQSEFSYYNTSESFGGYQFISLLDIISNFTFAFVGEDNIIPKATRSTVSFHAQRALAELSFDTFKSTKAIEVEVPPSLSVILPQDYVNYTAIAFSDASGVEHRIYPGRMTSNPKAPVQDASGVYSTIGGQLLVNSDFLTTQNPGGFSMSTGVTYEQGQVNFTAVTKWNKLNWNNVASKTGETYTLVYTISGYSGSGSIQPQLFDNAGNQAIFTARSANGTYTETVVLDSKGSASYPNRFWFQVANDNAFTGSIKDISLRANNLEYQAESDTWTKFKSQTPSENSNQDYNVDDDYYDLDQGGRRGLTPEHAQVNGTFYMDEVAGKINFSSNLSGKTIILKYISDSLGTDGEMQVHKFAEEAMYKHIAYGILSTRMSTPEYIVQRFKKERFAETRKAKLRLSNIKLEEIVQVLRNKSKFIKH